MVGYSISLEVVHAAVGDNYREEDSVEGVRDLRASSFGYYSFLRRVVTEMCPKMPRSVWRAGGWNSHFHGTPTAIAG